MEDEVIPVMRAVYSALNASIVGISTRIKCPCFTCSGGSVSTERDRQLTLNLAGRLLETCLKN